MNAIKRKPKAAARATRVITDPDEVSIVCQWMLGRESRPGEVLEVVHLRDQLFEVREVSKFTSDAAKARHAVEMKSSPPQKRDAED